MFWFMAIHKNVETIKWLGENSWEFVGANLLSIHKK